MVPWCLTCGVQETSLVASPHTQSGTCAAVKFALSPNVQAFGSGPTTYTFKLRIPTSTAVGACSDLRTFCGGSTCMVALADKSYKTCPAFTPALGGN